MKRENIKRANEIVEELNKIEGKISTAKAKDKLMNLSDLQTRLIVSLSEIVVQGDPAPAADIAFLLMMVLIIFS